MHHVVAEQKQLKKGRGFSATFYLFSTLNF